MIKILTIRELQIQYKIYHLIKFFFIFFAFSILCPTLISRHQQITLFGTAFSIISIPLAFISMPQNIIKSDNEDGSLEILLLSCSTYTIIISKYIALCICAIISYILYAPLILLIFSFSFYSFMYITICAIILILVSGSITILISSIQVYFRENTNFLSICIIPLIIPYIILTGLVLQNIQPLDFITIMIGISLIIIPLSLHCSSYLVENIYNV